MTPTAGITHAAFSRAGRQSRWSSRSPVSRVRRYSTNSPPSANQQVHETLPDKPYSSAGQALPGKWASGGAESVLNSEKLRTDSGSGIRYQAASQGKRSDSGHSGVTWCHRRFRNILRYSMSLGDVCVLLLGFALSICIMQAMVRHPREHTPTFQTRTVSLEAVEVIKREEEEEAEGHMPKAEPSHRMYVGVLSAKKFISTRVTAVHHAWGQAFEPHVQYYIGRPKGAQDEEVADIRNQYRKDVGVDVVLLTGASENEYPPQKKMFLMIKSMCTHLGRYQWFFRADDDVFVRHVELLDWLHKLNPNVPHYIGSFGFGRADVVARLDLAKPFCMGGPGVIMSNATMHKICPHIDECMSNVATGEEDTELGRCVYKHTGIGCTFAYEFWKLFLHTYPNEYGGNPHPYMGDLSSVLRKDPLTVHHLKEPHLMFRLAAAFAEKSSNNHQDMVSKLNSQLGIHTIPGAGKPWFNPANNKSHRKQKDKKNENKGAQNVMSSTSALASDLNSYEMLPAVKKSDEAKPASTSLEAADVPVGTWDDPLAMAGKHLMDATTKEVGKEARRLWTCHTKLGRCKTIVLYQNNAALLSSDLTLDDAVVSSVCRHRPISRLLVVWVSASTSQAIAVGKMLRKASIDADLAFISTGSSYFGWVSSWHGKTISIAQKEPKAVILSFQQAIRLYLESKPHPDTTVLLAHNLPQYAVIDKAVVSACHMGTRDGKVHFMYTFQHSSSHKRPTPPGPGSYVMCMGWATAREILNLRPKGPQTTMWNSLYGYGNCFAANYSRATAVMLQ